MSSSPRVSKVFDTDKRWMVAAAEASVASIILSAKMRSLEAGVDLIAILGRLPQGRGTRGWGGGKRGRGAFSSCSLHRGGGYDLTCSFSVGKCADQKGRRL